VPPVIGAPELAWHLCESLILDEFDITMVHELTVDHGLTVPLSIAFGEPEAWPCKVIPLCVNVIQYPPPTGNRCFQLGRAIRRAIESFPGDTKVAIFGTGGLSHQLQGERAGLINADYDERWLDLLIEQPAQVAAIGHHELIRETGSEGLESIMWLVMRGALDERVRTTHRFYHVPASNTAYGLILLE
jgi:protocatechuate 4,5-dioxygenase, beta chain